ncbi:hypothetical protein LIPSTDRAFT_76251 [Lipomyces starkeyi NRRL Y-11557]|uniref:Uncharacterized protein n=1 Tax=Lipomyces starkeyi NRRL Y-11557 TaxID=675824 RepID=A0A1E3PVF1_LIPST|nr:hypothetical protein LIPSTDRAFT_76251 [Lipomyces starkeyi NRRL Y-11557]
MSVIGDLDDFESAARGRQVLRQVAETYISTQSAPNPSERTVSNAALKRTSKRTVSQAIHTTETRIACSRAHLMEQSNLMGVVTRPLSPGARIEVPATWAEYEYAQEHLDNEGSQFPRLWYDSSCQLATVIAAPTPLHSDMVGELVDHFADTCRDVMRRGGISENIWGGLTVSSATTNRKNTEDGLTIREWDGAISYVVNDDPRLMVAFEVGVSQTYKSLQAAISWCVCALHCRLGIAMNITEKDRGERPTVKYYASRQEQGTAIQHARNEFRLQLRRNPFGPLEWNNITWFGKLREVIIETFRNEDPNCPPEALLEPTQSFAIVRDGRFSGHDVPPNLREVVLGDCVPSHILSGNEIVGTTLDFFRRSWFETKIRAAILKTAIERVEDKSRIARAH